ncbi:hypothetical protein L6452_30279 [Arctium lappa]|uniref:Uncharacterized protein n=1 Tax=Arctium lappa TaxID=4217 RepID=A0ACB8ZI88_ARCLA|nr:hypothetical protein L6452_30279 [Arctium lappa]
MAPTYNTIKEEAKAAFNSQQSSPTASYDIPTVKITIIEEPLSVPSVPDANFSNGTENNVGGTRNNGTTNPSNDTRFLMVSMQIGERQKTNDAHDAVLNATISIVAMSDACLGF